MYIRHAVSEDFEKIMLIYANARQIQIDTGNPNQWIYGYPQANIVQDDIKAERSFLCIDNDEIVGVFVLYDWQDPTYAVIDGEWLNDEPYLTIHRIAGTRDHHGIVEFCVNWVYAQRPNIRIDTHHDNAIMRHILPKLGFKECGIITTHNGTPRIAFQKCE